MNRLRRWWRHRHDHAPEVVAARRHRAEVSSLVEAARAEADAILHTIDGPRGHHG